MVTLTAPEHSPFGPHNLPYGVYRPVARPPRASATRYGDHVVDLAVLLDDDTFGQRLAERFHGAGAGAGSRSAPACRLAAGEFADDGGPSAGRVELLLPFEVADYVDFYASEHHAANLGRLFRPDSPDPLTPNWKHLPIGYHGRSSLDRGVGHRHPAPDGQRKAPPDDAPVFGPSTRLDIEAELGFVVGTANPLGEPIPVDRAEEHIFGVVLFNDWSARDIQAWEYVPLGPNLGKSFASTISPWVVPLLALEPARVGTPVQEPEPLPYLAMKEPWGLDIDLSCSGTATSSADRRTPRCTGRPPRCWPTSPSTAPRPARGTSSPPARSPARRRSQRVRSSS